MGMLSGKNILITGCARGIGKSMVEMCAKHGANIWANARNSNQNFDNYCKSISEQYSVTVIPTYFDLTSKTEIVDSVKMIRSSDSPINGLINNAGITYNSLFQMSSEMDLRENVDVNFIGPFILTQYIIKIMLRNGGG